MDVTFFESSTELRKWLGKNHDKSKELWIGFYKKSSGRAGITYPEAVDQALCFGWIDGIRKRVDETSYMNRFTPRRPRSNWSAVNIKRFGELTKLGLVHSSGLSAFKARDQARSGQYSYEQRPANLAARYAARFRENEQAWEFFSAQSPSYRRTATWWVMSAKKEETRLRRLDVLIDDSNNGRKLRLLGRRAASDLCCFRTYTPAPRRTDPPGS